MAKFRVVQTSYINERLVEPGEVVEVDTSVMKPGPNLEPVAEEPHRGGLHLLYDLLRDCGVRRGKAERFLSWPFDTERSLLPWSRLTCSGPLQTSA